ncbi:MAG: cold shock domain-containing protein [Planctomycetota bacterium]
MDRYEKLEDVEGEVKWFDPRKGYGFIVGPEGQDIFTHYSVIEGDGFRVLRDGSQVRYSAENGPKGWKATKVERLEPEVHVVQRRAYARTPRR